nr:uncharacterized protein LOC128701644 [Cherax quadricarinatus]
MRGMALSKCVLLTLTLLIPASHGRAYPWRKGSHDLQYQNHYGKVHSRGESRVQARLSSDGRVQGRLSSDGRVQGRLSSDGRVQGRLSSDGRVQGRLSSDGRVQGRLSSDGRVQGRLSSDGRVQGRLSSHHRPHFDRNTEIREIIEETFAELLAAPPASDLHYPPSLISNDLDDLGIGPEEEALYSARHDDRVERPSRTQQPALSGRYQQLHLRKSASTK